MVGRLSRRLDVVKDPPGGPEVVRRPSRRSGSGRETLPEVHKWSGDRFVGPLVLKRPYRRSEVIGRPTRSSRGGRQTLPEVRKWSGDPLGGPEVVEVPPVVVKLVRRPSQRSGTRRENLPEFQNWSGDPPIGLEVVGRPSQTSETCWETSLGSVLVRRHSRRCGTGWDTLFKSGTGSGDPPGGLEEVGRPSWRSASGRESHP